MAGDQETTGPKTFEAWGYNTLFAKDVFGKFAVIILRKKRYAFWAVGFEAMANPSGFCVFVGPFSIGVFSWKGYL